MSQSETKIFVVLDNKPIGLINSFQESWSQNQNQVGPFGSPVGGLFSVPMTMEISAPTIILKESEQRRLIESHEPFEIVVVDWRSKADCCGFSISSYSDCYITSAQWQSDGILSDVSISSLSRHYLPGTTREARAKLNMVTPNGWNN